MRPTVVLLALALAGCGSEPAPVTTVTIDGVEYEAVTCSDVVAFVVGTSDGYIETTLTGDGWELTWRDEGRTGPGEQLSGSLVIGGESASCTGVRTDVMMGEEWSELRAELTCGEAFVEARVFGEPECSRTVIDL